MLNDIKKIKILLTGNSRVGKTTIFNRYSKIQYQENFITTIGVDFCDKINTMSDDKQVNCQLWDTAGQERFKTIVKNYYKGASGLILVYDKTNKESFEELDQWVENINLTVHKKIPILLLANKLDAEKHEVTTEEGQLFATQHHFYFIEASAKQDINIQQAFNLINEAAYQYYLSEEDYHDQSITQLDKSRRNKEKCCIKK